MNDSRPRPADGPVGDDIKTVEGAAPEEMASGAGVEDSATVRSVQATLEARNVPGPRDYAPLIVCLLLFALALGVFEFLGMSGRRFLDGHHRYAVADSQEGVRLLDGLDVSGRTLVLFDRTSHVGQFKSFEYVRAMEGRVSTLPITPGDYISGLISMGVARQVYVVLPQPVWDGLEASGTWRGDFIVEAGRVRARLHGAPVVYVSPRSMPDFGEKVIVYVPKESAGDYPEDLIDSFDTPSKSDVFIVAEGQ